MAFHGGVLFTQLSPVTVTQQRAWWEAPMVQATLGQLLLIEGYKWSGVSIGHYQVRLLMVAVKPIP